MDVNIHNSAVTGSRAPSYSFSDRPRNLGVQFRPPGLKSAKLRFVFSPLPLRVRPPGPCFLVSVSPFLAVC